MSKQSAVFQLHTLYQACVNCPNTEKECPGIWRDIAKGVVPDGFYCETVPVDVLVVGKNTGHPDDSELKIYPGLTGDALYKRMWEKQAEHFQNGGFAASDDLFSRKPSEYLCEILGVENKDLFSRIAFTNLVKCRTPVESGNTLDNKTVENCFETYLKREVELLKPKAILALGRDAEHFLLRKSWSIGVPVLFLKHPSRPLKKEEKQKILNGIRDEINYFINRAIDA